MDNVAFVLVAVTICGIILTFFGWSHQSLSSRVDNLAIEMKTRKTDDEVRVLFDDKIEPHQVRLRGLSKQIDSIAAQYTELDRKIDVIIEALAKLR